LRVNVRRKLLAALFALPACGAASAFAQRAGRPARVGYLSSGQPPEGALQTLREGFRELGYEEGKSYVIVPRYAEGDIAKIPRLVQELGAERLDLVVSRGAVTGFVVPLRERVPVLFAFSGDPVEAGYAKSLAKPGLNMTGITFMALELSAKRVEVLKELVPKATRIALLSNPEHAGELAEYRVTDQAARRVGATISRYIVRNPKELEAAYGAIRSGRPDALLVFPDALTFARRKEIAAFAARERIPSMYGWTEYVESGGLVSYGPAVDENYRTLAVYADKILKGADANSLPIQQVTKIGLTLNMAAARALGLAIPQALLLRADRAIE
jgi:putative ABC transport system substrate-binding protein